MSVFTKDSMFTEFELDWFRGGVRVEEIVIILPEDDILSEEEYDSFETLQD